MILLMSWMSVALARNEISNPCAPILIACEKKGYTDDSVAEPGNKIWSDCVNRIINQQPVRGLTIEKSDVEICQKYRAIKMSS